MKKLKGGSSRSKVKNKPAPRVTPKKAVVVKVVVTEAQISWMGGDMNN